ncbi:MAG: SH3 domain-containing protein [Lachnospiraceae bacterium]|nr:SH3 domain-containing protein [Lachnospiraceae bacterium]
MKYNIQNYLKWRVMRTCVFMLLFTFLVSAMGMTAQAATSCKSKISYPGTTTSAVNMRKKAGTNYKSYGMLKKGQSVTILGWCKNKGVKWYKCKAKVNGKNKTGYVSAAYVKQQSKQVGYVNAKVTSTLNVRKSAKSSAKVLVKIPVGTKVTIVGITLKSSNYWYKVKVTYNKKTRTGYVSSKYITLGTQTNTGNSNTPEVTPKEQKGYVNEKVTSTLNVRKEASTQSVILMSIPKKTEVTILGTSGTWYKVTVTYNSKTVTGYVAKEYITIKEETSNDTSVIDQSFEVLLTNFPESYKASLRTLHNDYPNWKFVAVNTNLDWATVIANESVVGRNVIQSNYPRGTSTLAPFSYLSTEAGAYDWSTDKYVVKDGSNWYSANSQVISYYMDPRNFLNSTDIFQFEGWVYDDSQNATSVQNILKNTFMSGDYNVYDSADKKNVKGSYKQAFMDAGKKATTNPYVLITRVIQEVGDKGSNATSGTYKGYEGIYNFYNIGAFDGTNAVAKGLQWAKGGASNETTFGRPWTTPYKSIVGGAQYIEQKYINVGQNTLYFQKFNVKPTDSSQLYIHQYMTNVQAPYSEGRRTRNAYNTAGILSDAMVFYIPVYNNMPAAACQLPAATGNPNPYLSSIKLYNGETEITGMTPTFAYNQFEYSVVVPANVAAVTVKASAVSKYTTVTGTGTITLKDAGQTTTIQVVGTAQNGTKQIYTINVTRNTQ